MILVVGRSVGRLAARLFGWLVAWLVGLSVAWLAAGWRAVVVDFLGSPAMSRAY